MYVPSARWVHNNVKFELSRAVTIGVIYKERVYKGTPISVGTSNTLFKLLLNNVPWSAGIKATEFAHQMVELLRHHGRVCQLRKHTGAGGFFFEGEVSALLDISDTEVSYLSLVRNVYLDWCGRYVSASFKGAPVFCHYCQPKKVLIELEVKAIFVIMRGQKSKHLK
ncbi:hypothetical protein BD408DRAFT_437468 [Parasitella parasitica]|nr:hypothetical protein BD408DRAFT_437468 [Parasitella parasitica]